MGGAVGGIIGGVGSIIGGAMGADASSDAARAQQRAADRATEEQRRQYDQTREDMAPWRDTGGAALNRLAYMMGIGGYGSGGGGQSQNWLTEAQIREQLTPQFTTQGSADGQSGGFGFMGNRPQYVTVYDGTGNDQDIGRKVLFSGGQTAPQVDEAGLNAAVQKRLQEQQAQQQAAEAAARKAAESDSAFGSLLRRFTMDDYLEDPGYQFRLQQGEQAINRAAAAAGRYDSGRALKDLGEFNSGMASQEFGNAYNRWNNDQTNIFNRLSGVAGTGQQATNSLAQLGQNAAANIGNIQLQAGNAAAAGKIGSANAWGGALGGVTNALAQYFS